MRVLVLVTACVDCWPPDGSTVHEVYQPDGIAYDWINKRIFWTDKHLHRIFSVDMAATQRTTVLVTEKPRAIALDPCKGSVRAWSLSRQVQL